MADETQDLTPADASLDDVLAHYIAAEERGEPRDRRAILAAHPHLADELREFFANRDQMQRLAQPLRGEDRAADSNAALHGRQPLPKLRYFGDYELLEEVAVGGMGIVYRARQVSLNRIVAVKMILKGTLATEEDVRRFRAEAEAAANLQHPGIVAIHEVGLHEGQHYFSMDYVDGRNLAELVREQPLPIRQAAEYLREAAEGVHYAHQQGTLHRDLKPSNILIDRHDRVRITDFGLAKRTEGQSDLTLTGQVLGTPAYMPPEQATCKRSLIGAASDVYSLGAVLYELLAGRPPFRGETPVETLRQVESLDAVSPRLLNPAVPRDLETICLKCLEKEPHKRYGTAQLLADDLGRFLRHEPIHARPISRTARASRWCRRNPVVSALGVAVLLSLCTGTVISSYFGIQASARARGEREERLRANAREADAVQAHAVANEQRTLALARAAELEQANATLTTQAATLAVQATALQEQAAELRSRQVSFYRSLLKLARAQAQGNDIALADENLNAFPAEFRGWAWRYAKRLCHPEFLTLPAGSCVAIDPAGQWLAIGRENAVVLHSLPDGRPNAELIGHSQLVRAIEFLGSDLVISASDDGTVRGWNAMSGQQLKQLDTGSACRDLTVASDGKKVAVACHDGNVQIWDYEAGTAEQQFDVGVAKALSVAYSPDGKLLAVGLDDKAGLRLWNTATGEEEPRSRDGSLGSNLINFGVALEGVVQRGVRDVAFSPDGSILALAQADSLLLLDIASGEVQTTLSQHFGGVVGASFSQDGRRVASASSDGNVRIWDVADGNCLRTLPWHRGALSAVEFVPSQQWLVSADAEAVKVWDLSADWDVRRFPIHTDAAYSVAFDSEAELLATGGGRNAGVGQGPLDGEVRVLNLDSSATIFSHLIPATSGSTPAVLAVALSPDGNKVAAAGRSRHIHVFDVSTRRLLQRFENVGGQVGALSFHPDGKRLLAAGRVRGRIDGAMLYRQGAIVLEIDSGEQLHFLEGPEYAVFAPDGQTVIGLSSGTLAAWNLEADEEIYRASIGSAQRPAGRVAHAGWRIAVSPDQQLIAVALDTRWLPPERKHHSVELRDARSGEHLRTLVSTIRRDYADDDYVTCVYGVAFSPDGRELASASGDKTVRIWDVETGDELLMFTLPHQVFDVAFSRDGRRLAAASGHWSGPRPGEVWVWDALSKEMAVSPR